MPYAMEAQHASSASTAATVGTLGEAALQRRVSASCVAGSFIQSIGSDGSVTCGTRASSVELVTVQAYLEDSPADGWFQACFNEPSNALACSLMANRSCLNRGYAGGWFVGASSASNNRMIQCIR